MSGVYLITHRPSGKRYVGAGLRPHQRIQSHLNPRSPESWKWRLPAGVETPAEELIGRVLEYVQDAERDQAERDWWFLLKPELNGPQIPTMRGCAGGRLTRKSSCDEMRHFLSKNALEGVSSDLYRSPRQPKNELWGAVVDVMEKQAWKRRGHLLTLETLPCG